MQQQERTIPIIRNYQLTNEKFDIATLEYNIDRLGLKKLLLTQTLTPEFCVKYILNPEEHGMCREDHYICFDDIVLYQPHITMEQLEILTNNE
jgi:hypothetical protein